MRLFFDEITGKTQQYSLTVPHWFPPTDECSVISATASVSVSRQDRETVILRGGLEGRCKVPCDRCAEPYEENLQSDFVYLVTIKAEDVPEAADRECSDEDALVLHLDEPAIDVDLILREQALLAVPLKNLCREDCRGICVGCGLVLSKDPCRCQPDKRKLSFSVLGKLLDQ